MCPLLSICSDFLLPACNIICQLFDLVYNALLILSHLVFLVLSIGLAEKLNRFFHSILRKNPNELFHNAIHHLEQFILPSQTDSSISTFSISMWAVAHILHIGAQSLQQCLIFVTQGLYPTRLLCSWDSPGKNTGVASHVLLQGITPTEGQKLHLLHFLHCGRVL